MENPEDNQRQLAVYVTETATESEREALLNWANELLKIRDKNLPARSKAVEAVHLTARSKVIWPAAKMMAKEVKRHAWDERGIKSRFGLGGAAIGILAFGGQGAGIAALGTAIGVPLWVVLGAGATFAGMLVEELQKKETKKPTTSYSVIDADRRKENDT